MFSLFLLVLIIILIIIITLIECGFIFKMEQSVYPFLVEEIGESLLHLTQYFTLKECLLNIGNKCIPAVPGQYLMYICAFFRSMKCLYWLSFICKASVGRTFFLFIAECTTQSSFFFHSEEFSCEEITQSISLILLKKMIMEGQW